MVQRNALPLSYSATFVMLAGFELATLSPGEKYPCFSLPVSQSLGENGVESGVGFLQKK